MSWPLESLDAWLSSTDVGPPGPQVQINMMGVWCNGCGFARFLWRKASEKSEKNWMQLFFGTFGATKKWLCQVKFDWFLNREKYLWILGVPQFHAVCFFQWRQTAVRLLINICVILYPFGDTRLSASRFLFGDPHWGQTYPGPWALGCRGFKRELPLEWFSAASYYWTPFRRKKETHDWNIMGLEQYAWKPWGWYILGGWESRLFLFSQCNRIHACPEVRDFVQLGGFLGSFVFSSSRW